MAYRMGDRTRPSHVRLSSEATAAACAANQRDTAERRANGELPPTPRGASGESHYERTVGGHVIAAMAASRRELSLLSERPSSFRSSDGLHQALSFAPLSVSDSDKETTGERGDRGPRVDPNDLPASTQTMGGAVAAWELLDECLRGALRHLRGKRGSTPSDFRTHSLTASLADDTSLALAGKPRELSIQPLSLTPPSFGDSGAVN